MNHIHCEHCQDSREDVNNMACQECCDHEFDSEEGFMCLNCGKDGTEEMFSAAEAMSEGDR